MKSMDDKKTEVFANCDIVVEAFDSAEAKVMLLRTLMPTSKRLVTASGLAAAMEANAVIAWLLNRPV